VAWERRATSGGRYYTRSIWVDGKVRREYVGRGPTAEAAAAFDAEERAERQREAEARRAELERLEQVARAVDDYAGQVELLARAALYAAGYHQPNRSQWRRRRE
jgi:hypothetical protein